jgi:hypothetical protein
LVTDEQARTAAQEILAQSKFTRWDEDFESWLRAFEALVELIPSGVIDTLRWLYELLVERLLGGFLEILAKLLGLFGVFGESPELLGWVAFGLLVAAAIVLLYRVWGAALFEGAARGDAMPQTRTHGEAIREARGLAAEGRFLEAAHRVQLATLAMLIDFDWLELARSDPNRTLRVRIAESSLPATEQGQLVALIDRLESLWFDEPREDPELFEAWMALDDRLFRSARRGAP